MSGNLGPDYAMKSDIPPFASMMPAAESATPDAGTVPAITRPDHVHPRLSSTASGTLDSNGEATIAFTRTFTAKPAVIVTLVEAANNQPIVFKVKSWTQDGSNNYIGCIIKGYRSRVVPQNLTTLLVGGIYDLFAGTVTGAEFSLIAIQSSQ